MQGFTLVELIMILLLAAILAVAVSGRFTGRELDDRGFHDGTLAYLRFAQKSAIAQRRTVCVTFGANTVALRMVSTVASYDCTTATTALRGPRGEPSALLLASTGVSYVAVPADFSFDSLGRPVSSTGVPLGAQSFQVSGSGLIITVESGTGYVHD